MKIGLIDIDGKIPNLALMKISTYYKNKGNEVVLTNPLMASIFDKIYASTVFSWSKIPALPKNAEIGGSGYDLQKKLPEEIDKLCPDYSLYPNVTYSIGFLTRGCIRNCPWCIVPKKEGKIKPYMDIEEFARHDKIMLLDNNVLACDWGIKQIEKIARLNLKIDFCQGLDARLITDKIAKLLSKVKWWKPVRLACDMASMKPIVQKAVELLRWHNVSPRTYVVYALITNDIEDSIDRIRFLKGLGVDVYAQPYRDQEGTIPSQIQKDLARWVNHKAIFYSVDWGDYKKR
ncbi:MAG TPA: radical SAM protein [Candidatus Atribacteria bacterium]|nr:radical SAM protein [Candidatus Atribacteria bacterium]